MNRTKNKFTLKIMFSYLTLGVLTLVVAYFIFTEIRVFISTDTGTENDAKLLKTGSLLTELYEAESLSKLALQKKTQKSFTVYAQKIDSIFITIDSLKLLTVNGNHKKMLDSVQGLLKKKVFNSNELLRLKRESEANNSIDDALKEFSKIEESLGKITPESLNPNYFDLPPETQNTLKKWAEYLSENVPRDTSDIPVSQQVDSVLMASKSLLNEAKQSNTIALRSVAQKELQLNRADLEISQQLRSIISAFEQEVIAKSYNDNLKKQTALNRSLRVAGFASLLGIAIVGLFTFLITKDYWKVQLYRQQLEKEKKFSESLLKSREQLISTVSHDLRTPLNTITGYSELMENTGLSGKQVSYIKNVKSASKYVDSLVNDLLDFSKLEAGKINIEQTPFIFSDLIRETAENLKEIHLKKPLELIVKIDTLLDNPVLGDPFRIRQILTNLIGNAYKFTNEGFIKVEAKVVREANGNYQTLIQVTDSGIGIKKEKQEHIFKEFTQAEDHTDKKYGGYGLGLTISKKLTELLGGKISLRSQEDKGSTFSIEIPLKISKKPFNSDKKIEIGPQVGLSLLIIDDDPAMLKLLKEVCHHLGLFVHTYNNFHEILKTAALQYDMVLTDIQMPNITGFEVLGKLQNDAYSHYAGQPIVAMTGRKDLKREQYIEAGFSDILQKPFTKEMFLEVLTNLFPRAIQEKPKSRTNTNIASGSNLFHLGVISSFLGEDEEGIAEVLETFITDTKSNMEKLKVAVDNLDIKTVNVVSHRMLPMFRQLNNNETIPILEQMEVLEIGQWEPKVLKQAYRDLQNKSTVLILAIKAYLATSPNYSD
ncbi:MULTISPECIES: ATP-binding protein [unclassified Arenibacter]|uniref:hybrid sensor histidine kinase/response regulator n=1 Tax=unclassified Arenibacter TaxID=2615047 RepID=UPI000E34FEFF|nr:MULTISPECIES: ATP-binding protein [unclassified Arenibacter]MCM4163876.1 hybrid sensor histidine kinase/response regulator [Arenibacter sp. A80]RFT56585.1 response regulator [Arenibacter sp. P308M17]